GCRGVEHGAKVSSCRSTDTCARSGRPVADRVQKIVFCLREIVVEIVQFYPGSEELEGVGGILTASRGKRCDNGKGIAQQMPRRVPHLRPRDVHTGDDFAEKNLPAVVTVVGSIL